MSQPSSPSSSSSSSSSTTTSYSLVLDSQAETCSDTSPATPSNQPFNYKPYRLCKRKKKPAGCSSSSARGLPGPADTKDTPDTPCDQATQPASPEKARPRPFLQRGPPLQVGRRERPCPKHLLPQLTNRPTLGPLPVGLVKAPIPVPAKQPPAKPLPSKVVPARFPQEATAVPPKQPSGPK